MSEESKGLTEAEKRRRRRQKKILEGAGNRLHQITTAHSDTSTLNTPLPSEQSSPTATEAPANPFSSSRKSSFSSNTPRPPIQIHEPNFPVVNEETTPQRVKKTSRPPSFYEATTTERLTPSSSAFLAPQIDSRFSNNNELDDRYLAERLKNLRPRSDSSVSIDSTSTFGDSFEGTRIITNDFLPPLQEQEQLPSLPFPFSPEMMFVSQLAPTPQLDRQTRLWQLSHFVIMFLLGLYAIWSEMARERGAWHRFNYLLDHAPEELTVIERTGSFHLFWYFATIELILQTTRMFLYEGGTSPIEVIANTPSEILALLLRYKLIWNLWEDILVLVFVIGLVIAVSPLFSYFV